MIRRSVVLVAGCLLVSSAASSQVLRVPGQHATIASALAAARTGTTILVAPGTYRERLAWPSVDGIRLVGEQGAATTIIDGGKGGTVVTFGRTLTRVTILEGFTITGGFLKAASGRNYGAGIHIDSSSPTIRHNRITANLSDGTSWNYGGGVYVGGTGANPRIAHNQIDGNELRNGAWNYGAGIYVGRVSAEIIGNRILQNRNRVTTPTTGRGYGAGIYVGGSAIVASNLITGNTDQTDAWNHGGGIKVALSSGTAVVVNNTIVGNACLGGSWTYGGGIHSDASGGNVTIAGNIVVSNTVAQSSRAQGGGLYKSSTARATFVLDYNDVWNNTGGDYVGFQKGPNSIAKDPQFISASDWHVRSSSPVVEAMPASWLPAVVTTDMDGDPRRLDGNLDGLSGDGARLDMGADEFTDSSLAYTGLPKIGSSSKFDIVAGRASLFVFLLDFQEGGLFVDPYGHLLLGLSAFPVAGGVTPGAVAWAVPSAAALAGLATHHQALVVPLPSTGPARLTNALTLTMF